MKQKNIHKVKIQVRTIYWWDKTRYCVDQQDEQRGCSVPPRPSWNPLDLAQNLASKMWNTQKQSGLEIVTRSKIWFDFNLYRFYNVHVWHSFTNIFSELWFCYKSTMHVGGVGVRWNILYTNTHWRVCESWVLPLCWRHNAKQNPVHQKKMFELYNWW